MVCLGNICRSPMAEGIFRAKTAEAGIELEVDSAGTADYHVGEEPDPRAIENMRSHGIDISNLRGRQFVQEDFDRFDHIFTMDESNHLNVLRLARTEEDKAKVSMFLNSLVPGSNSPVPDPWFGGNDGFEDVFQMLSKTSDKIVEELKK